MRNDKVQKNTIYEEPEEPDVFRGIKLALRRRSHELGESGSRRAFGQSGPACVAKFSGQGKRAPNGAGPPTAGHWPRLLHPALISRVWAAPTSPPSLPRWCQRKEPAGV